MTKYYEIEEALKKRYKERMTWAKDLLGGKCVKCGAVENLDFDHIDPTTKTYNIGKIWGYPLETLTNELKKCQLLCRPCHIIKTNPEPPKHGTTTKYRYGCRCNLCREAATDYVRRRRQHKVD